MIWITRFLLVIIFSSFYTSSTIATSKSSLTHQPIPVPVKITVKNENWVDTISVCNTTTTTIPLTNIEIDFNYAAAMPNNIWGIPWAAWKLVSQTGQAVVLMGGTPYTPPLLPDPNCTHPLTIQFNASPDLPLPVGPFIFKAEGATPPTSTGELDVSLPVAPAANLPAPMISVVGMNVNQQQVVNWNSTWQLPNLLSGAYTITGAMVDNGTNFYAAQSTTAYVMGSQTTKQTLIYLPVVTGNVTVNLVQAPDNTENVSFTGKTYTFNKSISNGSSIILPADTYMISSLRDGYNSTALPNPMIVPAQTSLTITYNKNPGPIPSNGPYTTSNGQIIDGNNNPVTFQGVNWFGFNTGNHILHGLWQSDFLTMLGQIKSLGFNAVRIPFAFDFILDSTIKPNGITTTCGSKSCNTDIPQDSALNAFLYIVKKFTDNGIFVLLDDHYEDDIYINNQAQWLAGWKKLAQLFINNSMVGYDLYNEPDSHNLAWDNTSGGTPWAIGVDAAANAIYSIDQHKLIFIEGVAQGALRSNWGDGFATDNDTVNQGISNPKAFFTKAANSTYLNQLVISPHAYGPDGTNNQGPDHSNQATAYADWSRLHGYLYNNFTNVNNTSQSGFCLNGTCHIYPIAIGEFGGKFDPADPYYAQDTATLINLATYLTKLGTGKPTQPSWFYWDWNPNSGNTGGILKDDWATIDCNKVNYLKKYLNLQPTVNICN